MWPARICFGGLALILAAFAGYIAWNTAIIATPPIEASPRQLDGCRGLGVMGGFLCLVAFTGASAFFIGFLRTWPKPDRWYTAAAQAASARVSAAKHRLRQAFRAIVPQDRMPLIAPDGNRRAAFGCLGWMAGTILAFLVAVLIGGILGDGDRSPEATSARSQVSWTIFLLCLVCTGAAVALFQQHGRTLPPPPTDIPPPGSRQYWIDRVYVLTAGVAAAATFYFTYSLIVDIVGVHWPKQHAESVGSLPRDLLYTGLSWPTAFAAIAGAARVRGNR